MMDWIKVKDRLPEDDATVQVCSVGLVFPGRYDSDRDLWLTFTGWRLPDVTHWAPLLDPPEEEADDANR